MSPADRSASRRRTAGRHINLPEPRFPNRSPTTLNFGGDSPAPEPPRPHPHHHSPSRGIPPRSRTALWAAETGPNQACSGSSVWTTYAQAHSDRIARCHERSTTYVPARSGTGVLEL
eukprot:gene19354-biopygen14558